MSEDDLIRRGDALKSIETALNNATGDLYDAFAAIAALPAATVRVKPQDTPAVAKEISIFPPMAKAHDVPVLIASGDMDPLQKVTRVEDVCKYVDRILAALEPAPDAVEALVKAAEEVLRISDRDHVAWHLLRAEIAKSKGAS